MTASETAEKKTEQDILNGAYEFHIAHPSFFVKEAKLDRIVKRRNEEFKKKMGQWFGSTGTRACNSIHKAFNYIIDVSHMPLEYVMAYADPKAIACVPNCGKKSQELIACVRELYLKDDEHSSVIRRLMNIYRAIDGITPDTEYFPLFACGCILNLFWNHQATSISSFISSVPGILLANRQSELSSFQLNFLEDIYPKILLRQAALKWGAIDAAYDPITLVVCTENSNMVYPMIHKSKMALIVGKMCQEQNYTAAKSGEYKNTKIHYVLMKKKEETQNAGASC